jgi:hypothetical protein
MSPYFEKAINENIRSRYFIKLFKEEKNSLV